MIQDSNVSQTAAVSTETLTFFIAGAVTASTGPIARIRLPYAARLRRVFVNSHAVSGTTPTMSVTVKDETANSNLLTTGNVTTADTPILAQGDVVLPVNHDVSLTMTLAGTTPSYTNTTIQLTVEKCDTRDVSGADGRVSW